MNSTKHHEGVKRALDRFEAKPKKCVCGAEFTEKKDYYRHMHHMRCNEVDKPVPKRQPLQLSLFGGR